jgi:hypothetical protein
MADVNATSTRASWWSQFPQFDSIHNPGTHTSTFLTYIYKQRGRESSTYHNERVGGGGERRGMYSRRLSVCSVRDLWCAIQGRVKERRVLRWRRQPLRWEERDQLEDVLSRPRAGPPEPGRPCGTSSARMTPCTRASCHGASSQLPLGPGAGSGNRAPRPSQMYRKSRPGIIWHSRPVQHVTLRWSASRR